MPELSPASPEVRLNREYEPIFRRFCFQKVRQSKAEKKVLTKRDLRIMAREFVGCSLQTSYSYMEKLFAPNGPLIEKENYYAGIFYVDFRDLRDTNLTLEELDAKYPKEGQRMSQRVEER